MDKSPNKLSFEQKVNWMSGINEFVSNKFCRAPGQSRLYGTTRAWSSFIANIEQIEKDISAQSNSFSAEKNEAMKVTGHEDYNPDFADKEAHEDEGKMAEDPED